LLSARHRVAIFSFQVNIDFIFDWYSNISKTMPASHGYWECAGFAWDTKLNTGENGFVHRWGEVTRKTGKQIQFLAMHIQPKFCQSDNTDITHYKNMVCREKIIRWQCGSGFDASFLIVTVNLSSCFWDLQHICLAHKASSTHCSYINYCHSHTWLHKSL